MQEKQELLQIEEKSKIFLSLCEEINEKMEKSKFGEDLTSPE